MRLENLYLIDFLLFLDFAKRKLLFSLQNGQALVR